MVVEKFSDGEVLYDHELNNKQTFGFDTNIMGSGEKQMYVQILSSGDTPKVRLYLYGKTANQVSEHHLHGSIEAGTGQTGFESPAQTITNGTSVPQAVEIWIDGTQYTASIGDPNIKGATMYDSVNDDWGVDGTTIWDTGELDLSSEISWTVGEHYITFKETGNTGGRLMCNVLVN